MKIGAQCYTVRNFTGSEQEIKETLKKIKEIGYDGIQMSGFKHYDPQFIADTAKEMGLEIPVTHMPLNRILYDTENIIIEHGLMGAKYVGLGGFFERSFFAVKGFLSEIKAATKKIADSGLKFVYHNHAHEFIKYNNKTAMQYMIENTEEKEFGLLPDFYWVQVGGLCPKKFLQDNAKRIDVVHLKDMKIKSDSTQTFCEVFEGNMDYDGIMHACKKAGVEWAMVEQDECDGDPFESLKISYDNIKERGW